MGLNYTLGDVDEYIYYSFMQRERESYTHRGCELMLNKKMTWVHLKTGCHTNKKWESHKDMMGISDTGVWKTGY